MSLTTARYTSALCAIIGLILFAIIIYLTARWQVTIGEFNLIWFFTLGPAVGFFWMLAYGAWQRVLQGESDGDS